MNVERQITNQTRREILGLLSDDELRYVSNAEQARIPEGDEYLDLEHLELGVQQAEPNTPGDNALPRSAVSDDTWGKILNVLETPIGQA
ncbi:MAG: hypothetical protein HOV81_16120 [Kofleriaceae bacterium]|nr:hypothetical protein [Kofleriaceae bacterium]